MWNYFFRMCILNRTSVYLRLFDYVSDYVPRSSYYLIYTYMDDITAAL